MRDHQLNQSFILRIVSGKLSQLRCHFAAYLRDQVPDYDQVGLEAGQFRQETLLEDHLGLFLRDWFEDNVFDSLSSTQDIL